MLATLKKKSIGSSVFRFVVLAIISAVLLFAFKGIAAIQLLTGPQTLDLYNVQAYEGKYVTLDINYVIDQYAYTETTRNGVRSGIHSEEYIVTNWPADDSPVFIGAYFYKSDVSAFLDWAEQWASYDTFDEEDVYTVTGTLEEMDSESKSFFRQTLGDYEIDSSYGQLYYLKVNRVGGNTVLVTCLLFAAGLVLLGFGVFGLVKALTGGYQKKIMQLAAATPSPDATLQHMEAEFNGATVFGKVRFAPHYVFTQAGPTSEAIPVQNVVWAYQLTQRTNGIATSHSLMLGMANGKIANISMGKGNVGSALSFITNTYPHILVGHSYDIAKLFKNNRSALAALAAQQRQGMGVAQPLPVQGAAQPQGYAQPAAPQQPQPQSYAVPAAPQQPVAAPLQSAQAAQPAAAAKPAEAAQAAKPAEAAPTYSPQPGQPPQNGEPQP
ncbi:MAG: DUF6709 family protein [Oscillospiraceae bacterium]